MDGERYHWRDGEAVVFDETFIHYAENATEHNRIILFCDIERPLTQGWATAFNRWFSRNVMAAAAARTTQATGPADSIGSSTASTRSACRANV
ncbi:lipopolysaccharide biosynthetic protein LpxO1 [Pseudomonas aeruginosa]|nr:lipopolysaccharide biosynthetic protein LpxO1 [Pseudomonas aeruginosa]